MALVSIVFSLVSIRLINSAMFRKTITYCLYNRIWRWQLDYAKQRLREIVVKKR
ncbi:hypothetical protein PT300_00260 [Enterobacteriaceae bacterium ESL0689]|nr:hypothetical protein [Enterobacteriaceae bacterium ESL0689]